MRKRLLLSASAGALLLSSIGCTTTTTTPSARAEEDPSAKRRRIDAAVDAAIARLFAEIRGSRELFAKASGALVFPNVISAGFVVGGSYGEGALRTARGTDSYYQIVSAAVGLMAGAQSRAVFVLFMTRDALDRFLASKGWTAGVDASVAALTVGANGEIDVQGLRAPVIGFVMTNVGLMANLSLEGTRFIRIDP
jgi:lipid-binding SYLF domain-containing protein